MKEDLKRYLTSREKDYWYGLDSEMMCKIIDDFFEQYSEEMPYEIPTPNKTTTYRLVKKE